MECGIKKTPKSVVKTVRGFLSGKQNNHFASSFGVVSSEPINEDDAYQVFVDRALSLLNT
jgi:hypothetical protein